MVVSVVSVGGGARCGCFGVGESVVVSVVLVGGARCGCFGVGGSVVVSVVLVGGGTVWVFWGRRVCGGVSSISGGGHGVGVLG